MYQRIRSIKNNVCVSCRFSQFQSFTKMSSIDLMRILRPMQIFCAFCGIYYVRQKRLTVSANKKELLKNILEAARCICFIIFYLYNSIDDLDLHYHVVTIGFYCLRGIIIHAVKIVKFIAVSETKNASQLCVGIKFYLRVCLCF